MRVETPHFSPAPSAGRGRPGLSQRGNRHLVRFTDTAGPQDSASCFEAMVLGCKKADFGFRKVLSDFRGIQLCNKVFRVGRIGVFDCSKEDRAGRIWVFVSKKANPAGAIGLFALAKGVSVGRTGLEALKMPDPVGTTGLGALETPDRAGANEL